MTRDLVSLMQERTGDGYVFRTDLRLRPDPGATQVAMSTGAALQLLRELRPELGARRADQGARRLPATSTPADAFLDELAPFIWRKYLDFAAIADIHAMKRQIHAFKGFGEIGVAGHNIKLGRGGIREIEFFAQTQQLIAGGRQTDLRAPQTLEALVELAARGWIKPEVRERARRTPTGSCARSSTACRWSPTSRRRRCRAADEDLERVGEIRGLRWIRPHFPRR